MLDQILGRPSKSLRRFQISVVLLFWAWRLYKGDGAHPPLVAPTSTTSSSRHIPRPSVRAGGAGIGVDVASSPVAAIRRRRWLWKFWIIIAGRSRTPIAWMSKINERLKHFTPYQLILGTMTIIYALRHLDDLLGIGAPEPLAQMYSRSYYRATYVNTAFDAGFASAMTIRPKWLKDIMSVVFAGYYLVFAREGDEVLRRFRALCTVEMLRVTWEKTQNPYVRLVTWFHRPKVTTHHGVAIPRSRQSARSHLPPVRGLLFFDGSAEELAKCTELVVDFPGGGFIAMGPECHEERLRHWAKRTGKPVLGINYGKAPEYPYPWAIEEGFDAYITLMETAGRTIGIKSGKLDIVLTGDSAGGNICTTIMLRILEHHTKIPRPISIILAYPCLDFNYRSWMSPADLRVLRTEQSSTHIPGIIQGKDHMRHKSPLSVVADVEPKHRRQGPRQRQKSWSRALGEKLSITPASSPIEEKKRAPLSPAAWTRSLPRNVSAKVNGWLGLEDDEQEDGDGNGMKIGDETPSSDATDSENDDVKTITGRDRRREADKSLKERVKTPAFEQTFDLPRVDSPQPVEQAPVKKRKTAIGTRLTMTSRVGYFQDRVITPSMMRAMAILYVGPKRNPNFETDYYISPILSPPHLLAHFPPVYLICGERDPFVDDTVIFAGKVREAKRSRRAQAEALHTKSAKFGEGLRMSTSKITDDNLDHIIRETDDDWVQMRIIEGWGHGFMQMSSLMREVDGVLSEMADWIDESFVKAKDVQRDAANIRAAQHAATTAAAAAIPDVELSPLDHLPPNQSTLVKSATSGYVDLPRATSSGVADLDAPTQDIMDDNDGVIAFTPKPKRKLTIPSSRFNPVPRRASKEALHLQRSDSVPRFDHHDDGDDGGDVEPSGSGLSNMTKNVGQPSTLPEVSRGAGVFAFFNPRQNGATSRTISSPNTAHHQHQNQTSSIHFPYGAVPAPARRTSSGAGHTAATNNTGTSPNDRRSNNPLLIAAAAGARAASPALAAAGLVPQNISDVSEVELFRRRRAEAVLGLGDADSGDESDGDSFEGI